MKLTGLLVAGMLFAASSANAVSYYASFSGAAENPPNASLGSGFGSLDVVGNSIEVKINFSGLGSGLAAGHIHCCVGPGVNTGVAIGFGGLPLGATSGIINRTIDLTQASSFGAAFITASGGTVDLARARLFTALDAGEVYFNLHTTTFSGGEIRGNIAAVPEPSSWAMMLSGFGLVGTALRRRVAVAA